MKKAERYIYIAIIIILVGVLATGTTYMIMKNNERKDNAVDKNTTNNTQKEEKNNLSEKELEEYLSYIPDNNISKSVYTYSKINTKSIDYSKLLANVLDSIIGYDHFDDPPKVTLDTVNAELNKRYNIDVDRNITNNNEQYITGYKGICYYYDNEFKAQECGAPNYNTIHNIEKYEIIDSDLIIYEYAVSFWAFYGEPGYFLGDFYKVLKDSDELHDIKDLINLGLDSKTISYANAESYAKDYIKKHKKEFTKYKHTFKKNETGYYWYSTEVV